MEENEKIKAQSEELKKLEKEILDTTPGMNAEELENEIAGSDLSAEEIAQAEKESEEEISNANLPATLSEEEGKKAVKVKMPKNFNKKYSERKFKKRVLNKIYVPKDKIFIQSLYQKNEKGLIVPKSPLIISKKDAKRLALIAKQVKKQKGRVKWLPLLCTILVIFALFSIVIAFKNPILKAVLTNVVQDAAGAKCEIGAFDLRILDSRLEIDQFAVANKKEPMTNLAEFSTMVVDFDLVQLLKGRFVSDEISIEGIQVGTQRQTSGEIEKTEKQLKKEAEKAAKKAALAETTPEDIQAQIAKIVKEQTGLDKESFTDIFSQFNPETIVNSVYESMESPEIIRSLQPQAEELVKGWQDTSAELTKNVQDFVNAARELANTDVEAIKNNPAELRKVYENLQIVSKNGEAIKISVENAATQIKVDAQTVGNISKAMQEAVQNDLSLVNSQINALTSINFKDMASLFSGELDGPALQMLRKYMPVAQTVLAKVEEFQTYGSNKEKQPKKEKTETNRLAGRTIEYRADTIPDVLIRKISLSGVLPKNNWGVYGTINNISSDCNKLNKPIDIKMGFSRNGSETETLSALIDMRNNRKVKAFTASLSSKGWAFNNLTIPNAGNLGNVSAAAMAAIPALSGLANFNAEIGIDTDLSFDINGGVNVLNAILDIKPFEPAFAYSLYSRAIENIKELNLNALAGFSPATSLKMNIVTDVDKILADNLSKLFKQEVANIRAELVKNVTAQLTSLTSPLQAYLGDFIDIEALIKGDTSSFNNMNEKVEAKMAEIKAYLTEQANAAVNQSTEQAKQQAAEQVKEALKDTPIQSDAIIDKINDFDIKDLNNLFKKKQNPVQQSE